MSKIPKDALFLIDGSYLLYRSYYGLRPLQTSKGVPTQATYGFCRTIKKLVDEFDPTQLALVWDSKGKTFRSEMYEPYKATRQAPPSDLFVQKEQIMEFADTIDLLQLSKTGYEADDLIASIVHDFKKKNIVIVGPDKDLYQLISDRVVIFDPFKDRILDYKTFKQEKGYGPEKVAFFYALLGDTSDNIPGVKGIGKKTAEDLVKTFESLKDLYENIDKVKKERTKKLLEESKDDAFLSLKLFTLKHYKLNVKIKDFEFKKNNLLNAVAFFKELEFSSLLRQIQKELGVVEKAASPRGPKVERQISMFENGPSTFDKKLFKKQQKNWNCIVVDDEKKLEKLFEKLKKVKEFAFDTETSGLDILKNNLVGFSFAFNKKDSYYVPLAHETDEKQLDRDFVLKKLKPIFEDKRIKKILHHTKFDQWILYKYGIKINNVSFDTLIAACLLKKRDEEKIGLKSLSTRLLDEPMQTFKQVMAESKHKNFAKVSIKEAAMYGAYDSLQTFKLKQIFQKELEKHTDLKKIFEKLEMPLSQVLLKMETFGILLDEEKLRAIGVEIEKDVQKIEKKVLVAIAHKRKHATTRINLNSPAQIEKFLFDELKLPVIKKSSKGRRSTDQEVLSELSKVHPIPGLILKFRELTKLKSTYIEPIIKQQDPETKRVHTSFSQTLVATGRLSSFEPNLQNIPAGKGYGIEIRSAFVTPRSKMFLAADYSQIDLRSLAHLSKDKHLIDAFLHDKDIHALTASQVFDIPVSKVKHEQRQIGKRINFGIIYGLTPFGLSKDLGIKPSQAKEYIEKYFQEYKGVKKFIDKTVEFAKTHGYTKTWMGRRRYVPQIHEQNRTLFEAAKRVAVNSPVQGTSSEIMKLAMLEIEKQIEKEQLEARMVLQIHDEIILELPQEEQKKVEKLVKNSMIHVVKWEIPLKVSLCTGKNWKQITK